MAVGGFDGGHDGTGRRQVRAGHRAPVRRRSGVPSMSATVPTLEGRKLLLTGPTGVLGSNIARRLAASNDVWAIARFSDPSARSALEAAGVSCVHVDLDRPDFT